MGEFITLKASDGFELGAYRAAPAGAPRAGLVVLQEIFGVNAHIQRVAESYAAEGYLAIAPALYDRVERGLTLGYQKADIDAGLAIRAKTQPNLVMLDVQAAIDAARDAGKVGVVGYCWGGTLAYLAAAGGAADAAVSYYGGQVKMFLDRKPQRPIIFHIGENDHSIPAADIEAIRVANPDRPLYTYPGVGHGFNCDERADFNAEAAQLARGRTLDFLGGLLS